MRIGIDLGGTKIEAVSLSSDGALIDRIRVATPVGDYEATLRAIKELAEKLERNAGRSATIGIGTPGSIHPISGKMQNSNSVCLNGKTVKEDLEHLFGRPIRLANDADCFALSEATDGAGSGFHTVFGVIIGTGVGGGFVVDGKLISGPNALTGEWGHTPLKSQNPRSFNEQRLCYCGRTNCVETWLSGPALEMEYHRKTGIKKTMAEIADPSRTKGDHDIIPWFLTNLAVGLGTIINTLDPDCIIFGGGLSNIDQIYTDLPTRIPNFIMADQCLTVFAKAKHGDSSGVFGAAHLWP